MPWCKKLGPFTCLYPYLEYPCHMGAAWIAVLSGDSVDAFKCQKLGYGVSYPLVVNLDNDLIGQFTYLAGLAYPAYGTGQLVKKKQPVLSRLSDRHSD